MATNSDLFQRHLISMPTLGRKFKLGDIYSYNTDTILTDYRLSWGPEELASVTQFETKWEKRFDFHCNNEYTNINRAKSISLDNHMQLSFVTNLLDDHQGATVNYLNDRPESEQVTCTMMCCAKINEENMDLVSIISQEVPYIVGVDFESFERDAYLPHVVTSVFYGAEVYCVLAHGIDDIETDEEGRQKITQKLSNLASKWLKALEEFQELAEFKKRFDREERLSIARIKCRLYADLQSEPVLHCDFFAAYERSLELMNNIFQVRSEESESRNAIPITIQLCPLKVLVSPTWGVENKIRYGDISKKLTKRCYEVLAGISQVVIRAERSRSTETNLAIRNALEKFIDLISEYRHFLQGKLKHYTHLARRGFINNLAEIMSYAENHPLFKPLQLEQWLNFKLTESEMMDLMDRETGMGIQLLTHQFQLDERQLSTGYESTVKKYSVFLRVPPLDDWTNAALKDMKTSLSNSETIFQRHDMQVTNVRKPWHITHAKRKIVLEKIVDLKQFIVRNGDIFQETEFIVCQTKAKKMFQCDYYVFDNSKKKSYHLHRLPDPPSGLRIYCSTNRNSKKAKTSLLCYRVEWDYEELGLPCLFLLHFRQKGSSDKWVEKRTFELAPGKTQLNINFSPESTMEIRMATETCIGRSEFTQIFYTDSSIFEEDEEEVEDKRSLSRKKPIIQLSAFPCFTDVKGKSVAYDAAVLEWSPLPGDCSRFSLRIEYWQEGEDYGNRSCKIFKHGTSPCYLLKDLRADTKYFATISNSTDVELKWSSPSNAVVFTTVGRCSFAESLVMRSEKINSEDGKDVYAVPLEKRNGLMSTGDRFVFGEAKIKRDEHNHRTILLIGAHDSSKTSLIDSMVNYVFGVDLGDPFRFQLIDPLQENQNVNVYDINYTNGLRVNYSLTIIDTPNYVNEDPEKNKRITELIQKFFDDKAGIQQVDMVGFVVDSSHSDLLPIHLYIYLSLITIFGEKIRENVNFLCTNPDEENPSILSAIIEDGLVIGQPLFHTFKSSFFFCADNESFENFFSSLILGARKSTSLSKQVLDETEQLKADVLGLSNRLKEEMEIFEELRKTKEKFKTFLNQENAEFEVNVIARRKRNLPLGLYINNCIYCESTCRPISSVRNDVSLPDDRMCRVCPRKCSWKEHVNQSFMWRNVKEKQVTTVGAICETYEALKETLTRREVRKVMFLDYLVKKKDLVKLIHNLLVNCYNLNRLARRLNGEWKTLCVEVRVKVSNKIRNVLKKLVIIEKKDAMFRFNNRIAILKRLQVAAELFINRLVREDEEVSRCLLNMESFFHLFVPIEEEEDAAGEDAGANGEDEDSEEEIEYDAEENGWMGLIAIDSSSD